MYELPKVVDVLRRIMTNEERPAEERAAAASCILFLVGDEADDQTPAQPEQEKQDAAVRTLLASFGQMRASHA